jgi:carboxylate-amine ligase
MLEHAFKGPPFTVGIEEELMILDSATLDLAQAIEPLLEQVPAEFDGQIKSELMASVLEIATKPCRDVAEAGRELAALRRTVGAIAAESDLLIGAAGTHPFARWEDQRIVDSPRYHELVDELGYLARRELIFGTHVHVAIEGADRAIYVADGIRNYLPLLLALSANSPFWRGHATGMRSTREAVFRAFPRQGIPPHYGTWEIYSNRVDSMVRSSAIEDYTFMWWDVRPHPKLGTVEVRVCDQQTSLDDTLALAALTAAIARRFSASFDDGRPLVEHPSELIDDNKIRAAMRGIDANLIDFRAGRRVAAARLAEDLIEELDAELEELGCKGLLAPLRETIASGTGADRQLEAWERDRQLSDVVRGLIVGSAA